MVIIFRSLVHLGVGLDLVSRLISGRGLTACADRSPTVLSRIGGDAFYVIGLSLFLIFICVWLWLSLFHSCHWALSAFERATGLCQASSQSNLMGIGLTGRPAARQSSRSAVPPGTSLPHLLVLSVDADFGQDCSSRGQLSFRRQRNCGLRGKEPETLECGQRAWKRERTLFISKLHHYHMSFPREV